MYKLSQLLFLAVCFFGSFTLAQAAGATLSLSPANGTFSVGERVQAVIRLHSGGDPVNAAEATLNFSSDALQVISLSKADSIFSLWAVEPTFNNATGVISFGGGTTVPFSGSNGKILSITFLVKKAGEVSLSFSSGRVLAADGTGTDVFSGSAGAGWKLAPVQVAPPTLTAPTIFSPTHPDQNKWYGSNDVKLTWTVPSDVTGVRLLVGRIPRVTPTILYVPAVSEKEIADLEDGVSYFHAQFKNARGWGEVSHFRLQIDTEEPSRFDIAEVPRKDAGTRAEFIFDARDKTSGVEYYEISIDGTEPVVWRDKGTQRYEAPAVGPGKHTLVAKVVDRAGNSRSSSVAFIIEGLSPPTINEYPKALQSGESLTVQGSTYPHSSVTISLQREENNPEDFMVKSSQNGTFTFTTIESLKEGTYTLWAKVVDAEGRKSSSSEKITIVVGRAAAALTVDAKAAILSLLLLIAVLLLVIWRGWRKFVLLRKRLQKEIREAGGTLHKAFDLLKDDIREQVKMLEHTKTKRELTKEEEKILKHFKSHLDDAEKFIRKEIDDIENEIT